MDDDEPEVRQKYQQRQQRQSNGAQHNVLYKFPFVKRRWRKEKKEETNWQVVVGNVGCGRE